MNERKKAKLEKYKKQIEKGQSAFRMNSTARMFVFYVLVLLVAYLIHLFGFSGNPDYKIMDGIKLIALLGLPNVILNYMVYSRSNWEFLQKKYKDLQEELKSSQV